jgi:CNT family concentrative nucleoside transporter
MFHFFEVLGYFSRLLYSINQVMKKISKLLTLSLAFIFTPQFISAQEKVVSLESAGFSLESFARGALGMAVLLLIAWLFSSNRKAVNWKTVGIGLGTQVILAVGILYIPAVQIVFETAGNIFVKILDFSMEGTKYLFKSFDTGEIESPLMNFAVTILPTIIFFSALTSVLFYYGIIQKIVYGLAWLMTKVMKLSGAESLSVAGNIFLGQTESPLMIKAYLEKMNKSEILLVMAGGMATLAGGVLAVYISVLGGTDPVQRLIFAKHLLAASVMAAPGVVVISKILVPQTEQIDSDVKITGEKIGKNVLDAISNGTGEGLRLAVNVGAMLLVFVAFIALINYIFLLIGDWTSLNSWVAEISGGQYKELSLQFILGYVFAPFMWLLGVASDDITLVGRVLGEKIIMTEFIGYISLGDLKTAGAFAEQKSVIMSTYMLAGFANFASIGIQIGGIGSLAPGKRVLLSQFGMRALLAGTLASLMSATIVGMILG